MFNYPSGFRPRVEQQTVELICPICGWTWDAVVLTELGCTWYADEDFGDICPECGEKGEEI